MSKAVFSVPEFGKWAGVSRKTAYDLANSEGFPAVRIGKRIVIPIAAAEQWLEEHIGGQAFENDVRYG